MPKKDSVEFLVVSAQIEFAKTRGNIENATNTDIDVRQMSHQRHALIRRAPLVCGATRSNIAECDHKTLSAHACWDLRHAGLVNSQNADPEL